MNKARILVVDDEPSFNRLMKIVLEGTGRYTVHGECDSTQAIETARQFQPDLIVLDMIMPKVDGMSIAETLRSDAQFLRTPIVFLTATVPGNETGPTTIASFPVHAKPIAGDDLMRIIDHQLASARSAI